MTLCCLFCFRKIVFQTLKPLKKQTLPSVYIYIDFNTEISYGDTIYVTITQEKQVGIIEVQ